MSCHDHEADVVDLARGVGIDVARGAAAKAHLEACPGCAARFEQERQLTKALRTLAERASDVEPNAEGEQRLREMFEAGQAAAPVAAGAWWSQRSARTLALAASLALVVGAAWGVSRWQRTETNAGTPSGPLGPAASHQPTTTGRPTEGERVASATAPSEGTGPAAKPVTRPEPPSVRPPARAIRRAGPSTSRAAAGMTVSEHVDQFVTLPAAESLPEFESGVIVRVELPVSSLPAYGLPMAPNLGQAPVEADVLVGQDGQPRAIRLVSIDTDARRRQ